MKTRLSIMDATDRNRVREKIPVAHGRRCRVGDPHSAFVADKETMREQARWWDPEMKAHWDAANAWSPEGVDAADKCKRASGQELTAGGERTHVLLAREPKDRGPDPRKKLKVFGLAQTRRPSTPLVDTR